MDDVETDLGKHHADIYRLTDRTESKEEQNDLVEGAKLIHIGEFIPSEVEDSILLKEIVSRQIQRIEERVGIYNQLRELGEDLGAEVFSEIIRFRLLTLEEYFKYTALSYDQIFVPRRSSGTEYREIPAHIQNDLAFQFLHYTQDIRAFLENNKPTVDTYRKFLGTFAKAIPALKKFYIKQYCYTPPDIFRKHSYIIGGTGSGKSELIKFVLHNLIKNKEKSPVPRSLVVIEPHGKFCEELVRHSDFPREKTLYLDCNLDEKKIEQGKLLPAYNPFDFPHTDIASVDPYAQSLMKAFADIIGKDFSPHMETILKHCFQVLIRMKGTTIKDLIHMVSRQEERWQKYHDFGCAIQDSDVSTFFKYDFTDSKYNYTKDTLGVRINSLMNPVLSRVLTQKKSTFNIEKIVNEGGIALLGMKGLGEIGGSVLGRLLIARIKYTAFARPTPESKRPETFLFVDECHNYISDDITHILTEGRQYKICISLASQTVGQNIPPANVPIILGNTMTKFAGKNDPSSYKKLSDSLRLNIEEMETLKTGQFYFKSDHLKEQKKAFKLYVPDWYIGFKGAITSQEFADFKKEQLQKFYSNNYNIQEAEPIHEEYSEPLSYSAPEQKEEKSERKKQPVSQKKEPEPLSREKPPVKSPYPTPPKGGQKKYESAGNRAERLKRMLFEKLNNVDE